MAANLLLKNRLQPVSALAELGWPKSEHRCHHCERPLSRQFVWLELNCRTGAYHLPGFMPAEVSQGQFPIGSTCAKGLLA